MRALAEQQVIAQAEPGGEPGQALGVDHRGPQPSQLTLVRRLVGVVQVLRRDQLQHRVAQVLQPLVVGQSGLGVLVVVGAMGQRLPKQRRVVEADAERPLESLERLVGLGVFRLRW